MIGLTTPLLARIKRMAEENGETPEKVLCDAVLAYWVRWACNKRLKPEEW